MLLLNQAALEFMTYGVTDGQSVAHLFFLSLVGKKPPANAGGARDVASIPGWGRSPGVGSGDPLQYSCLENPMDRGVWWATVHGVTKSQTQLSNRAPEKEIH